jgi:hypothetical protein
MGNRLPLLAGNDAVGNALWLVLRMLEDAKVLFFR